METQRINSSARINTSVVRAVLSRENQQTANFSGQGG